MRGFFYQCLPQKFSIFGGNNMKTKHKNGRTIKALTKVTTNQPAVLWLNTNRTWDLPYGWDIMMSGYDPEMDVPVHEEKNNSYLIIQGDTVVYQIIIDYNTPQMNNKHKATIYAIA
jgi:hypothetical protein